MKKWIFSMALFFSFFGPSSSQKMIEFSHHHAPQKFSSFEVGYIEPDSVSGAYLSVKAMEIKGFDDKSMQKLEKAFAALEQAVNSEEFKDRVINFKNTKGERSFASNNGLTNEEIYQIFMDGREILQPETQGEMNFYLNLYYRPWSRVIGYTYPKANTIYVNWRFFKKYKPHEVAANLAHEWTHKMGFDHKSAKEHDSAPYAIGYIVGEISSKILKRQEFHY